MEFRILGPLEVHSDGRTLDLGGHKQRALLAMLLLEANRVVSSDRLIDALWEDHPPPTARKALQVHVSHLRKLLGADRVDTQPPGYRLRIANGELDSSLFRAAAEEDRPDDALALWRGPPLGDVAYEPFAQAEIARLEELRARCLEERNESELARGRHAELTGDLEALVLEYPLRERLRAQLMLCLYRCGRQADALEAFTDARVTLVEELGIEPGRELRELHQAILEQDPKLDLATTTDGRGPGFVGREHELAALAAGLDDALAGQGRVFLVSGEPGIGKSRLADELIAMAGGRGVRVLTGRCWEAGGAPAYWPWVEALREYVRESDSDTLREQLGTGAAEVAQLIPDLRQRLPGLAEPPAPESESARFRLFDAVADFVAAASGDRPIVLVLDDVHAADEPSLLLLRFMARRVPTTRVLILAAYRDVDPLPGEPLAAMQAEVLREPGTRRLALQGLSEAEVTEYLESAGVAAAELVAPLHAETDGNPLFVGEIVRLLAVEGTSAGITVPRGVREVIVRRLGHLSADCNRALVAASVIGREFALDLLAGVADLPQAELLDVLDEAMTARVASEVPGAPDRARFAHVLIRDALYDGLTSARRVQLHRLTAETLEALRGADPGPHLAELARHSIAATDFGRGAEYARRAGDRALGLHAYEEAARLYSMALAALDRAGVADERARCELLLSLGDAEMRGGDSMDAKAVFLEAAAAARRLGLPEQLARAAAGYGGRTSWARMGDDEQLVPLLEEGLAAAPEEDVELRARLLARLAGALRDMPDRERRDRLSREAVELARASGNPSALAYALDGRVAAIVAADNVEECVAEATELTEVAISIGDRELTMHGHLHRATDLAMLGRRAEADAALDAAASVAAELGQPVQLWQVRAAAATVALGTGRLAEAEALIPAALALGEHSQPEMAIPVFRMQRYVLYDLRGDPAGVADEIRELVAEYPARPVFRCALAQLEARLGREADARRELESFADGGFAALPFDHEWLYGMSLLTDTAAILGDAGAAAALYDMLVPWDRLIAADHPEGMRGSVARYLGMLASMLGRSDEAERHFEDAVAVNARIGALPWLAYTQDDFARMLAARGRDGDAARAQALRDEALAGYAAMGMAPRI